MNAIILLLTIGGGAALGVGLLGGSAAAVFFPVTLTFGGLFLLFRELDDKSIKEQIEGAGIFTFAKLSYSEMKKAKLEADKIISEIKANIKKRRNLQ